MEYNRLEQSWEEEEKSGNLSVALKLQKKQIGLNINHFLDHFREEPLDKEVAELWKKGLDNGIIFDKEIKEILSPIFHLQKKLDYFNYQVELLNEGDDVMPEEVARIQRHFIGKYAHLEKKTAVLMARFDEAETSQKLGQAIPGIVESIESTVKGLYEKYLVHGEFVHFIEAYYIEVVCISHDPVLELQKILSITNYLLHPEKGLQYQTPEKVQKMQLYRKYAIWAIQALRVSEKKMNYVKLNWSIVNRDKVFIVDEIADIFKDYSLLELLSETLDTIQEMRRIS